MGDIPRELLREHRVSVRRDNRFQQRARLLQALWREERGLPIGRSESGIPLGSRLPREFAEEKGANLMTDASLAAARREVAAKRGRVIEDDRLWENLLSSQPLAFNLFSELEVHLDLAARVLRRLWPERIGAVTRIAFEHSPGRGISTYTDDGTSFDVYVEHTAPLGGRGFVGIEVKYQEDLRAKRATHRPRYDEVTTAMGCFKPDLILGLRREPIEQLWRDHMLAGSMLLDTSAGWESGLYVFLYPEDNKVCRAAVQLYREHLSDARTFDAVTLEAVVAAIEAETDAAWIRELRARYLGWEKIERLLAKR